MNLKHIILLSAIAVFSACNKSQVVRIKGEILEPGKDNKILVFQQGQLLDSTMLQKDHTFELELPGSNELDFYVLKVGEHQFTILAQNGDKLHIKANLKDQIPSEYILEGSSDAEKLTEFHKIVTKHGKIFMQLSEEYKSVATLTPNKIDSLKKLYFPKLKANQLAFYQDALRFAQGNKGSLVGFYALGTIDPQAYKQEYIEFAKTLKVKFTINKVVQTFLSTYLPSGELSPKPAANTENPSLENGAKAPDFSIKSPLDKDIRLSDFRGRYVLLDFWASWCGPCRQANPELVSIYKAKKNKKFTIFSISLDRTREDWLEAIKEDQLSWPDHGSDLQTWHGPVSKLYQVTAIPQSYLIDPTGKIVLKTHDFAEVKEYLDAKLK